MMRESCKNCGSELFPGQRYCRLCGTAVDQGSQEDVPTQILPPDGQAGEEITSPISRSNTDPIFSSAPTAQPPLYAQQQTVPLGAHAPSPSSTPWGRITAFIVLGVIGIGLFVTLLFAFFRQPIRIVKHRPKAPAAKRDHIELPGVSVFSEEDSVDTNGESVATKTLPLEDGAILSLRNMAGDITVEGWDEPHAEVKIIKRGGSTEDREAAPVVLANDGNRITLTSPPLPGHRVEVHYDIKVPRQLSQLEIASTNSKVNLSNIAGEIGVDIQRGEINLLDVSGAVNTNLIKGHTKVVFDEAMPEGPQKFSSVKGNIEVQLKTDVNADIKAETFDGEIKFDETFKLKAEQRAATRHVVGRIGAGGKPILIKTMSGNIKLTK